MTTKSDPLLSLTRAADFLGVNKGSLRRWAKRERRLDFWQVGTHGHLKFRQSELEKFAASQIRSHDQGRVPLQELANA